MKTWIDTPDLKNYEAFISQWHYFLLDIQEKFLKIEEEKIKSVNMFLIQSFYLEPYNKEEDFYSQFKKRLEKVKKTLETILD